jgi:hypothetical protein
VNVREPREEDWLQNRRRPCAIRRHFVAIEPAGIVGYAAVESRLAPVFRVFLVIARRLEPVLEELRAAEAWFAEYAADEPLLALVQRLGFTAVRHLHLESGQECVVLRKRMGAW